MDPGGRLRVTAAPPFWLIAGAYGDALGDLRPEQIVGATSGRIVANRTGLTGPFAVDLD